MVKNKKKIVYIVTKASWGGAQKYVLDLVSLTKKHYDISVICGRNEFDGPNAFIDTLEAQHIPVYQIEHMGKRISLIAELRSSYVMYRLLRTVKPHVVHLNSPKAGGIGGLVSRFARVPKRVYTIHGLNIFEDRPVWQKKIIAELTRMIFSLSDKLICISQLDMNYVTNRVRPEKVVLVHNGITPFETHDDARTRLERQAPPAIAHKLRNGASIVGNIAELTHNKGLGYLLQALAMMKDESWVYIHYGTGELEQSLLEQVNDLGLQDHVWFVGFDKTAKQHLAAFDVLAFSSVKEGLPYVPLEAGYVGVPVVASRVGGMSDIITPGHNGLLVSPKDSAGLKDALIIMLQDQELRDRYGRALQKTVQDNFSLEQMVNKTREVYNAV